MDGRRLRLPMFARGCQVDGNNIVVWSRLIEPVDFEQVDATPVDSPAARGGMGQAVGRRAPFYAV